MSPPHSVCIVCGVARLNIYLPDELAAQAKAAGLNLSAVTQAALRRTLAARSTDEWLARLAGRGSAGHAVDHEAALAALDAARDEPPTHHG
jgi:post-segregation antitoxin (ccd killing protein)